MAKAVSGRAEAVRLLAEAFREHGFEGASLATISKATGLGKGSLYHFFPAGKEEMTTAVLEDIDAWFEGQVFAPLVRPHAKAEKAQAEAVADGLDLLEMASGFGAGLVQVFQRCA